jgi:hypothetical protein
VTEDGTPIEEDKIKDSEKYKLFNSTREAFKNKIVAQIPQLAKYVKEKLSDENKSKYQFLIANDQSFVDKHLGKYPVIHINFKNTKGAQDFAQLFNKVKVAISETLGHFTYIYDDLNAKAMDNAMFQVKSNRFIELYDQKADEADTENAMRFLCTLVSEYFNNKKVIIIVDEYDTPMTQILLNWTNKDEIKKGKSFIRGIYSAAFKDTALLEKGFLTGIFKPSSDMLSDFNNAHYYTILERKFSSHYGVSKEEATVVMDSYGLSVDYRKHFEQWYNGYNVAGKDDSMLCLYNPFSFFSQLASEDGTLSRINKHKEAMLQIS